MSDPIKTLDAKWLDPECHDGCISLLLKNRLAVAEKENAQLKHIQENGNPKLSVAIAELCGWSWNTKVPGAWHKYGKGWCHILPSIPDMFAELKKERDEFEQDACRYRYLRDAVPEDGELCVFRKSYDGLHTYLTPDRRGSVMDAELDKLKGMKGTDNHP